MRLARFLALAAVLGIGFHFATAADDNKEIKEAILKLADAVGKNDKDAAKKLVDEIKKAELEDVMNSMKPVAKGGIDVGFKEGIETKLNNASKKPGDVKATADSYAKLAKVVAAVAEVAAVKCTVKAKEGEKDPKKWEEWVGDMKEGAKALSEAAKSKDAKAVSAAVKKIDGACKNCHGVFRD